MLILSLNLTTYLSLTVSAFFRFKDIMYPFLFFIPNYALQRLYVFLSFSSITVNDESNIREQSIG